MPAKRQPVMNRRSFLQKTLAVPALSTALLSRQASARTAMNTDRRPNLLVISTDQQFAGAMSCAGNPHLRTPNMDRIARRGTRFDRAYCPNPICVPSRTSYMTGRLPHETTVTHNTNHHEVVGDCGAAFFRDAGYDTGHVGKWHIPRPLEDREWSGFDYVAETRSNRVDFDIPAAAAEFLRKPRDNPFLLFTSFVNPHDICEWARIASGIEDTLKNGDIPPLPTPEECPPPLPNFEIPSGEPTVIRQHQAEPGNARTYPVRDWGGAEDGRWRQYLWAYYRMTELVDGFIGEVLDTLEETGQADNTAIVLFSDHGDGMGAHRWNQKTLFYEECARVPFIVSWPGRTPGGALDAGRLVNLGTDLFPTLFEIAGIPQPDSMRGLSAAGTAAADADAPAHPFIVVENNLHPRYGESGIDGRMVRTERWKYIRFPEGENPEQLFDLALDPGEMHDLATDPGHREVLQHHRRLLNQFIEETNDTFPKTEV